jgi:hypothetical protein
MLPLLLQGRLGSPTAVLAMELLKTLVDVGQTSGQAGSCHRRARLGMLVHCCKGSAEHSEIDAASLVAPVKPVGEAVARIGAREWRAQAWGRDLGSSGLATNIGHAGRCRQALLRDSGDQELVEAVEAGRVDVGSAGSFDGGARGKVGVDPQVRADGGPLARLAGLRVSSLLGA